MNKVNIQDLLEWAFMKGVHYERMRVSQELASERAFQAEQKLRTAALPKKKVDNA